MKKLQNVPVYFTFLIFMVFASCSPTLSPFTQDLYNSQKWTQDELKQIQFYLSDNIVLQRQVRRGSSEITSGEIKIVDGRKVEEVIFQAGTPGVMVYMPKYNRFAISFEDVDDSYLMFGPNEKRNGKYMLLASDWEENRGELQYDGKKYQTTSSSAMATLLVDLKKMEKISINSRKAGGRTVNN